MSMNKHPLDVDTVYQAWIDAGRQGDVKVFVREYCAKHEARTAAAEASASSVDLWIRRKGTRRHAFWRVAGTESWDWIDIIRADRAEREGRISVGPFSDAKVTMYQEP